MLKLAATYSGPRAPFFRGQNGDFSDDDWFWWMVSQ
jgi:hypothetical protein